MSTGRSRVSDASHRFQHRQSRRLQLVRELHDQDAVSRDQADERSQTHLRIDASWRQKVGIRAETRFGYTLKYATYYNSSGVKLLSTDGIWMKTSEEYCINSAASGGNCTGNDEVVTTYEYNHPNLLMTGMLVTSPDGTRRTCFSYDDFGNQIGVTTPNANLASCPGVTP